MDDTTAIIVPIIILVTVNDNETQAVLDEFLGGGNAPAVLSKGGLTYFDLGLHGGNRIIHTI